jgi:hypothetical protein
MKVAVTWSLDAPLPFTGRRYLFRPVRDLNLGWIPSGVRVPPARANRFAPLAIFFQPHMHDLREMNKISIPKYMLKSFCRSKLHSVPHAFYTSRML